MIDLGGKRVLVLGLGISGRSAAAFCLERGARVVAHDQRATLDGDDLPSGVELHLGGEMPDPADFDLVVPSPGVPWARYGGRARVAWGDIELTARALQVPIVAVTGTNGKSTTVRLIEAMLTECGLRARAAGNVGDAALGLVGAALDVAVLEVSSFQLEAVESFRPRVGIVLGCTPDHLDRHGTQENYLATKLRIFGQQGADDIAIINADDAALAAATTALAATRWCYSVREPVELGAFLDSGGIRIRTESRDQLLPLDDVPGFTGPLRGNLLAALLAVAALGAEPEKALRALADFRRLPHRLETVAERGGVRFINDSKATNPGAAAVALAATPAPVVWIAGGRDKGADFGELRQPDLLRRVKVLLTIGEAAEALTRELAAHVAVEPCEALGEAVRRAHELAVPGDAVLLAPACASFDQYANYEARGEHFRALVGALA